MAEVREYIPLKRQIDITLRDMLIKGNAWEVEVQESIVILLRSLADAMERHPEHIPPPNFNIEFALNQNYYNVHLVAKVTTNGN